eukprot:1160115-Pelagomonas_calceolata.AAC.3
MQAEALLLFAIHAVCDDLIDLEDCPSAVGVHVIQNGLLRTKQHCKCGKEHFRKAPFNRCPCSFCRGCSHITQHTQHTHILPPEVGLRA